MHSCVITRSPVPRVPIKSIVVKSQRASARFKEERIQSQESQSHHTATRTSGSATMHRRRHAGRADVLHTDGDRTTATTAQPTIPTTNDKRKKVPTSSGTPTPTTLSTKKRRRVRRVSSGNATVEGGTGGAPSTSAVERVKSGTKATTKATGDDDDDEDDASKAKKRKKRKSRRRSSLTATDATVGTKKSSGGTTTTTTATATRVPTGPPSAGGAREGGRGGRRATAASGGGSNANAGSGGKGGPSAGGTGGGGTGRRRESHGSGRDRRGGSNDDDDEDEDDDDYEDDGGFYEDEDMTDEEEEGEDDDDDDDEVIEDEDDFDDEMDEDDEDDLDDDDGMDDLQDAMDRDDPEAGLRALLRRLGNVAGAAVGGGAFRQNSSRLREILAGLRQADDPSAQMAALSELNEILVISGEELLMQMSLDSFVPALVECMTYEYMPDIMLLAARALTTMADVMPPSRGAIIRHGALAQFCSRLLTIEYIDLAEQSLQALEKLSQDYGAECARQGALTACLSYLDFFSIGMQRVSLQTATNICRSLPSSALDGAADAVPILANLLSHDDARLADCACVCLTNIAAKMAAKEPERVVKICQGDLIDNVVGIISPNSTRVVSPSTYYSLIKLLNICVSAQPDVAVKLLRKDLPLVLSIALSRCKLLTTTTTITSTGPHSASPASSGMASPIVMTEQLLEVATLADALLPAVSAKTRSSPRSSKKGDKSRKSTPCSSNIPLLTEQEPQLLVDYARHLANVLMQAVDSSVPQGVKLKCLSALTKWTQLSSDEAFKGVLESSPIAAFIAGQLASRDPQRIQGCLDLVEFGMEKKAVDMAKLLRKEGAVHALRALSEEHARGRAENADNMATDETRDATKTPGALVPALGGGERGVALRAAALMDTPEFKEALAHANRVFERYFVAPSKDGALFEDPAVERLRSASTSLRMKGDSASIVEFLESMSGASTFELLECDAVASLKHHLLPKDWKNSETLLRRYASFIEAAGRTKDPTAFATLVQRLLDALASSEDLSITVASVSQSSTRHRSETDDASLAGLVRPFKVQFKKTGKDADLIDYSSNVVLVEPFATLSSIEDFLFSRVHKPGGDPSTRRRSSRLSPPANMDHDDDEDDDEDDEDDEEIDEEYMSDDGDAVLGDEELGEEVEDLDLTNEDIQEDAEAETEGRRNDSFAARAAAANAKNRLVFSINGVELHPSTTILQIIGVVSREQDPSTMQLNWDKATMISYRLSSPSDVGQKQFQLGGVVEETAEELAKESETVAELGQAEVRAALGSFVPALTERVKEAVSDETTSSKFNDLLVVLTILHELSACASRILLLSKSEEPSVRARNVSLDEAAFVHGKLTAKLTRQLQDTVTLCSASTPTWCAALARACPWLFPFESRQKLFKCVSFSLARMLHHLHGDGSESGAVTIEGGREIRIGRLQRQKVRVSRGKILESAKKVFAIPNTLKMVLEVEFFEEVGTGTGPTLEFFTLLSKDFRSRKLNLWRDEGVANEDDLVVASHGLFPAPITVPRMAGKTHATRLKYFKLLGQAIGKVLQDGRMLDLPLAPAFYRMLLGRNLGLFDLIQLDPGLGNTLLRLRVAADEIERMKRDGEPETKWRQVKIDGVSIEDLCLTFVLPGSSLDLIKGGSDVAVSAVNLREYVDAVIDACVGSGVATYFESVRSGLEEVLPLARLKMFTEGELDALICGQGEQWSPEMLVESIHFDHGYSAQSPPIRNFCEILSSFSSDQQRAFMRFVTGAPRLPPGGLAALQPRLTVVCKQPASAGGLSSDSAPFSVGTPLADGDLPSAMTCASYLKLPPYSSKEIMAQRLHYAMNEGQGSFDLS